MVYTYGGDDDDLPQMIHYDVHKSPQDGSLTSTMPQVTARDSSTSTGTMPQGNASGSSTSTKTKQKGNTSG